MLLIILGPLHVSRAIYYDRCSDCFFLKLLFLVCSAHSVLLEMAVVKKLRWVIRRREATLTLAARAENFSEECRHIFRLMIPEGDVLRLVRYFILLVTRHWQKNFLTENLFCEKAKQSNWIQTEIQIETWCCVPFYNLKDLLEMRVSHSFSWLIKP